VTAPAPPAPGRGGADDTVRLPVPPRAASRVAPAPRPPATAATTRAARRPPAPLLLGAAAATLLLGAGLWFALRAPEPAVVAVPPAEAPAPPPVIAEPAPAPIPLLDEAAIAAHRADVPTLLRLAENGRVFVIDFPDLDAQAAALNRVAALIEKRDQPRDRVLSEPEIDAAARAGGGTPATYYYGHDYRSDDLDRFFGFAARDGVALRPEELWVRDALARARREAAARDVALISVAASGPGMDDSARRAILRHEIGHGHDFTLPFFNAHVRRVWHEWITEADRAAFRAFLAAEGYDTDNEELMATEFQAYLLFTPDPRFFRPDMVRLPPQRIEAIRRALRDGPGVP